MPNDTANIDSILLSVKKLIGLTSDYTQFDADLIIHINSTFAVLNQLGVGPEDPFTITGNSETWDEFVSQQNTENVRSYMFMKVKMLFDPPSTATMHEAYSKSIEEMEWRLTVAADPVLNEANENE